MTEGKQRNIYIFGAHSRSQTLGVYLTSLCPGLSVAAYLVDNEEKNPAEVDGVPVVHLDDAEACGRLDRSFPVYLGTRGVHHEANARHLRSMGFSELIPVTADMDAMLRNQYVPQVFCQMGRRFEKFGNPSRTALAAGVYVACSAFDRFTDQAVELSAYERVIQAGCDCTNTRLELASVFDNTGENISGRNRQFCELTALYWIWKNAKEDVVGLEHYRRRFLLPDDWLQRVERDAIDVILPVPLYVHPSLGQNYRKRHTVNTWEAMMDILGRKPGECLAAMDFFEHTGCYSPCNMLIARREVLDDLCGWLFPVIFEVAGRIGELEDSYQNRYPGFLSERLMTFFFFEHSRKYHVVYADKSFVSQGQG